MNTRRSGWTSAVPNARELRSRRSPRLHRHSASRALQEDEGDVERALSAARIAAHPTRKFSSGTVDGRPAIVRALAVVTRAARVRHVLGVRNVLGHANAMVARHGNCLLRSTFVRVAAATPSALWMRQPCSCTARWGGRQSANVGRAEAGDGLPSAVPAARAPSIAGAAQRTPFTRTMATAPTMAQTPATAYSAP